MTASAKLLSERGNVSYISIHIYHSGSNYTVCISTKSYTFRNFGSQILLIQPLYLSIILSKSSMPNYKVTGDLEAFHPKCEFIFNVSLWAIHVWIKHRNFLQSPRIWQSWSTWSNKVWLNKIDSSKKYKGL